MTTEENTARAERAHGCNGSAEACLVAVSSAPRRRSVGTQLAERKIAAQDVEATRLEGVSQCDEKLGLAVRARAMRQDQRMGVRGVGAVLEASDGRILV